MRKGLRGVAMVVMTVPIVEEAADMLTQGIIKDQERVSFRTTDRRRLLEQILDTTIIDAVLKPWRFREEAGEIGFIRTL